MEKDDFRRTLSSTELCFQSFHTAGMFPSLMIHNILPSYISHIDAPIRQLDHNTYVVDIKLGDSKITLFLKGEQKTPKEQKILEEMKKKSGIK